MLSIHLAGPDDTHPTRSTQGWGRMIKSLRSVKVRNEAAQEEKEENEEQGRSKQG